MSIIIKGMDMPKRGEILVFDGGRFIYTDSGMNVYRYKAIEIPTPHGRLIEGDVVANMLRDILTYVDEETILEAEE